MAPEHGCLLGLAEVTLTLIDPEVLKEANDPFVPESRAHGIRQWERRALDSFESDEPAAEEAIGRTG